MQYGVLVLLIGALIATLLSNDIISGFKYFRSFWRFGLPFLVFLALKNRQTLPYLRVILVVSTLIAIYACIQSFTGLDLLRSPDLQKQYLPYGKLWNAVGAFSHHLTYGGVTLILFSLFTPPVFDKTLSRQDRLLFAIGAICNSFALLFTLGRSIWMGAIAAIAIMVLVKSRIKYLILVACLAIVSYAIYTQVNPVIKNRFFEKNTIGHRISSINMQANKDRLMMWQTALNIIKDHPVLGLGPGNSKEKQKYYNELAKQKNHKFLHSAEVGVHNIYLQNWVDFGLVGILGYLFWWLILLFEILLAIKTVSPAPKGIDSILTGLLAGFIGIMIAGIFENNFRDGEVQTAIFTAMGIALALIYQKRNYVWPA